MVKMIKTKRRTIIYKTLHSNLKIEKHEPHKESGVNSAPLFFFNFIMSIRNMTLPHFLLYFTIPETSCAYLLLHDKDIWHLELHITFNLRHLHLPDLQFPFLHWQLLFITSDLRLFSYIVQVKAIFKQYFVHVITCTT
jgi:hypothetical protein